MQEKRVGRVRHFRRAAVTSEQQVCIVKALVGIIHSKKRRRRKEIQKKTTMNNFLTKP